MEEIHHRLKYLRESYKMNQMEFSDKIGITQSYLSALELGKRELSSKLIIQLIELFKVSSEWILTGKGKMITSISSIEMQGFDAGNHAGNKVKNSSKSDDLEPILTEIDQYLIVLNSFGHKLRDLNMLPKDEIEKVRLRKDELFGNVSKLRFEYKSKNPEIWAFFEDLARFKEELEGTKDFLDDLIIHQDKCINNLLNASHMNKITKKEAFDMINECLISIKTKLNNFENIKDDINGLKEILLYFDLDKLPFIDLKPQNS